MNILYAIQNFLLNRLSIRIARVKKNPYHKKKTPRFEYQKNLIEFDFSAASSILDIGSGHHPFPHATILADRYVSYTIHRAATLKRDNRPFTCSDVSNLSFRDKCFDFVNCSHVLEHLEDPLQACKEIIRVGRAGYIETPAYTKDMLFAWAEETHLWRVVAIADRLCFFEYSPKQRKGVGSTAWRDTIYGKWYHPLQDLFQGNKAMFNTCFNWRNTFTVYVFRQDGSILHN